MTATESGKTISPEFQAFKTFDVLLSLYESHNRIPPPLDSVFLDFIKGLGTGAPNENALAFTKKYRAHLSSIDRVPVIRLTTLFRRVYPESKLEDCTLEFFTANSTQNLFAAQWKLLKKGIKHSSEKIMEEVAQILKADPSYEEKQDEIRTLLTTVSLQIKALERQKLLCGSLKDFELEVTNNGFQPTEEDVKFVSRCLKSAQSPPDKGVYISSSTMHLYLKRILGDTPHFEEKEEEIASILNTASLAINAVLGRESLEDRTLQSLKEKGVPNHAIIMEMRKISGDTPHLEKKKEEISRILHSVSRGKKAVVRSALLCRDHQFFDWMVNFNGYVPTGEDMEYASGLQFLMQRTTALERLMDNKAPIPPGSILEAVKGILNKNPPFDGNQAMIRRFLDRVPSEAKAVAREALKCKDPRFFDLMVTSYGYQPTAEDLKYALGLSDADQRAVKLKLLIEKGAPIPADILKARTQRTLDFRTLKLLLAGGYQPSEEDLDRLRKEIPPHEVAACLELLLAERICFRGDVVRWVRNKFPIGQKCAVLNRFLPEEHDELYQFRLEEILSSPITQFSPRDAVAIVYGKTPFYKRYRREGVTGILSYEQRRSLLSKTPFTPEIFEAVLVFKSKLFNLNEPQKFLALFPSGAPERIFEAVLLSRKLAQKGTTREYVEILVDMCQVSPSDFRRAIDASCSVEILSLLSNSIMVETGWVFRKLPNQPGSMIMEIGKVRGGHKPTAEDLAYAKEKGAPKDVLDLIEARMAGG